VWLNEHASSDTKSVVTIPNYIILYTASKRFVITLTLQNFLRTTSYASVSVYVDSSYAFPNVYISSPPTISLNRWQPVNLYATATLPLCYSNPSSTNNGFSYSWQVFDGVTATSVTSESLDDRTLKLSPYVLSPSKMYKVQVQAVLLSSKGAKTGEIKGTASVQINTGVSGISALIYGGTTRTISISEVLSIDASSSYDIDFPSDSSSILKYKWSCISISPTYGQSCIDSVRVTTDAVLTVPKGTLTAGYSYYFTVVATSTVTGSTANASTTVQVTNNDIPMVYFTNTAIKYNPSEKVILNVEFTTTNSRGIQALWQTTSNYDLEQYSLVPLQRSVDSVSGVIQLALAPDSLAAGNSYTFQLYASYDAIDITADSSAMTTASISILMNAAPVGGMFVISPSTGYALNTTYLFSTSRWLDDSADLPLQYTFQYYATSFRDMTLVKAKDQSTYKYAYLSDGWRLSSYKVTGVVSVYDIYDASATLTTTTVVKPVSSSAFSTALTTLLTTAVSNSDPSTLNQVISGATKIVNNVVCSGQTPSGCAALKREQCRLTADTCGPCLSGYSGVPVDSNDACTLVSNAKALGAACNSDADCLSTTCSNRICAQATKSCPNSCNLKGSCIFTIASVGKTVTSCNAEDSGCIAKCQCRSGYYGQDCSLSLSSFNTAEINRQKLCESLNSTMNVQDVTAEVVQTRALTVSDLMQDITQINDVALASCAAVLISTIKNHLEFIGGNDVTLTAVNSALSNIVAKGTSLSTSMLNEISNCVTLISAASQSSMVVGEPAISLIDTNMRMSSAIAAAGDLQSQSFSSPLLLYESANGIAAPIAQISASNETVGGIFGVTMVQYTNNPLGGRSNSSIVGVQTNYYQDSYLTEGRRLSAVSYVITVKIPMAVPLVLKSLQVQKLSILCRRYETNTFDLTCPDGYVISGQCPGTEKGWFNYTCPGFQDLAICTSWDESALSFVENDACKATSYDDTFTTCKCETASTPRNRRSLSNSPTNSIVMLSSSFKTIVYPVTSEFYSGSPVVKVQFDDVVVSMIGSIALVLFLGIIGFFLFDQKEFKIAGKDKHVETTQIRTIAGFFDGLLPPQFKEGRWFVLFFEWLQLEHSWLNLITPYREDKQFRCAKWVLCMSKLVTFLFINTIFASLYYADDGVCENIQSESVCNLSRGRGSLRYTCTWSSELDYCMYNPLSFDFITLFTITIVVTVFSVPINSLLDYLITQVVLLARELLLRRYQNSGSKYENKNLRKIGVFDGLKEYYKIEDELRDSQNRQCMYHRAARLRKLQEYTDFVLPTTEVESLMALSEQEFQTTGRQNLITSKEARDVWATANTVRHSRYGFVASSKKMVLKRVLGARADAEVMKNEIEKMEKDEDKEAFIMKNFVVNNFYGYQKVIASKYFLGNHESDEGKERRFFFRVLYALMVPAITILMLIAISTLYTSVGTRASAIWLMVTFLALIQDIFILQPIKIFVKYVVITSQVSADVRQLLDAMSARYISIIHRSSGNMNDANSLIQHFNPSCRLARMFPGLPVSRFLIALNDYDTPYFSVKYAESDAGSYNPIETTINKIVETILALFKVPLIMLHWLPMDLQDSMVEVCSSLFGNGLMITLYAIGTVSPLGVVVLIGCVVGAITFREYRISNSIDHSRIKLKRKVNLALSQTALSNLLGNALGKKIGSSKVAVDNGRDDVILEKTATKFATKFKPSPVPSPSTLSKDGSRHSPALSMASTIYSPAKKKPGYSPGSPESLRSRQFYENSESKEYLEDDSPARYTQSPVIRTLNVSRNRLPPLYELTAQQQYVQQQQQSFGQIPLKDRSNSRSPSPERTGSRYDEGYSQPSLSPTFQQIDIVKSLEEMERKMVNELDSIRESIEGSIRTRRKKRSTRRIKTSAKKYMLDDDDNSIKKLVKNETPVIQEGSSEDDVPIRQLRSRRGDRRSKQINSSENAEILETLVTPKVLPPIKVMGPGATLALGDGIINARPTQVQSDSADQPLGYLGQIDSAPSSPMKVSPTKSSPPKSPTKASPVFPMWH